MNNFNIISFVEIIILCSKNVLKNYDAIRCTTVHCTLNSESSESIFLSSDLKAFGALAWKKK